MEKQVLHVFSYGYTLLVFELEDIWSMKPFTDAVEALFDNFDDHMSKLRVVLGLFNS